MGVTYDNITGTHTLTFGSPIPTDNVSAGVSFKNTNTYVFDLKDFPAGILPSGGSSNIASASEVVMCQLREDNYSPRSDRTYFEWHKAAGIHNADKIIYSGYGPEFVEDPNWTFFYSFDFSIIGHFTWEINEPGYYYVIIKADGGRGNARIDFQVIDTRPSITFSEVGFGDNTGVFSNCSPNCKGKQVYIYLKYNKPNTGSITLTYRYNRPNGTLVSGIMLLPTAANTNGSTAHAVLGEYYDAGNYSNLLVDTQK